MVEYYINDQNRDRVNTLLVLIYARKSDPLLDFPNQARVVYYFSQLNSWNLSCLQSLSLYRQSEPTLLYRILVYVVQIVFINP